MATGFLMPMLATTLRLAHLPRNGSSTIRSTMAWLDQWAGPIALRIAVAATLILVAALLVSWILRRSAASLRHRVWALAILGLLAYPLVQPFLPKVSLGLSMASPESPSDTGPNSLESPSFARTAFPVQDRGLMDEMAAHANRSPVPLPALKPRTADDNAVRYPAAETPTSAPAFHWPSIIAAIWAIGAAVGLGFLVNVHLAASRLVRPAIAPSDPSWSETADVLAAQLRVRRRVPVRISDRIAVPVTAGWLHAVILLPTDCDGWAGSRRRMVLIHEMSHVARGDVLWQIAAKLACVIYWPHPLVWLAARRMRVEREAACDDAVLRDVERPSEYASLLLDVAASSAERPIAVSTALAMACGRSVEERIRRIVQPGRCRLPISRRTARLFSLGAILFVLGLGSISIFRDSPMPAAPEPTDDANTNASASPRSPVTTEEFPQAVAATVRNLLEARHMPFVPADRQDTIEKDFREFVRDHQPGDLSVQRRTAILESLDRNGAASHLGIAAYDAARPRTIAINGTYLSLPDQLKTLKWKLWMAMRRDPLTAEQQSRRADQREWMRNVVRSLPEGEAEGMDHKHVLASLDNAFDDPLCAPFDRPMTAAQFASFKKEIETFLREAATGTSSPGRYVSRHNPLSGMDHLFLSEALSAQWAGPNFKPLFPPFDGDKIVAWGVSGLNMCLSFGSNRDFGGDVISLHDFAGSYHWVADVTTGSVVVVPNAESASSKREKWLSTEGRGDFAYDGEDMRLFAVRGAKLLRLNVEKWFDADAIDSPELRKRIEADGKDAISLADDYRREDEDRFRDFPGAYIGVLTEQGRVAVVHVSNFYGKQHILVHTRVRTERPRSELPSSGR